MLDEKFIAKQKKIIGKNVERLEKEVTQNKKFEETRQKLTIQGTGVGFSQRTSGFGKGLALGTLTGEPQPLVDHYLETTTPL